MAARLQQVRFSGAGRSVQVNTGLAAGRQLGLQRAYQRLHFWQGQKVLQRGIVTQMNRKRQLLLEGMLSGLPREVYFRHW